MLHTRDYQHIKVYFVKMLMVKYRNRFFHFDKLIKNSRLATLISVSTNLERAHNTRSVNKISMLKISFSNFESYKIFCRQYS